MTGHVTLKAEVADGNFWKTILYIFDTFLYV